MIEVVKSGMLTSIQDLGRHGYRQIGVGQSGAMDEFAYCVANILLGNSETSAGLEITLGGCVLKFHSDTTVAFTGCDVGATLDGCSIPPWSAISVKAGQILKTSMSTSGLRAYIAIAGGIDVPIVMGSRSTDLKAGFGGLNGRALKDGDQIELLNPTFTSCLTNGFGISRRVLRCAKPDVTVEVRMIPAAQWDSYSHENQTNFLQTNWVVTPQSNRLGYRLSGPIIEPKERLELFSHGILPGCVQMPPSGQPVIQLNDANTCGGYPKLGVVIQSDLRKLAQIRPGGSIRFRLCSPNDAVEAIRNRRRELDDLRWQSESIRTQLQQVQF
ncbi:5-oxoprolinase subunit C family protein [Vibrio sp. WJH972]